jgi:hypothetical protein
MAAGETAGPSTSLRYGRDEPSPRNQALTPNLISLVAVAALACPIKPTLQGRPIRSFGQLWLRVAQDASPGLGKNHEQSQRDG